MQRELNFLVQTAHVEVPDLLGLTSTPEGAWAILQAWQVDKGLLPGGALLTCRELFLKEGHLAGDKQDFWFGFIDKEEHPDHQNHTAKITALVVR